MPGIPTEDLVHRFGYHLPSTNNVKLRHDLVRRLLMDTAIEIVQLTGNTPTREQSLAITALEEAMMWANAAIARHQPLEVDDAILTP